MTFVALLLAGNTAARLLGCRRVTIGDLPSESRVLRKLRERTIAFVPNDLTPCGLRPMLFTLLRDRNAEVKRTVRLTLVRTILDDPRLTVLVSRLGLVERTADEAAHWRGEFDTIFCHLNFSCWVDGVIDSNRC